MIRHSTETPKTATRSTRGPAAARTPERQNADPIDSSLAGALRHCQNAGTPERRTPDQLNARAPARVRGTSIARPIPFHPMLLNFLQTR